ncbi:FMN-binding negative transcriptional regulator [Paenibacillus sp. NPDC058071]|uniref:FMN-binding negative transcriptional regulator n=1 Tax=Paenibacillus sp. NPDC058071 TaxID=3346326 RepID=UPI0036DDCB3F
MYVPEAYEMKDWETVREFIEQNSFGLLISNHSKLTGTHLPFLLVKEEEELYLYSHMARANPQWEQASGEVLVVFSGAQSYITPSWYPENKVPTWNYLAAHLYGDFELITGEQETLNVLATTVQRYESDFAEPWSLNEASEEYVNRLVKHVVAFKIRLTNWEATWKLHQDYAPEIQRGVINGLQSRGDDNAKKIAEIMKKNLSSVKAPS